MRISILLTAILFLSACTSTRQASAQYNNHLNNQLNKQQRLVASVDSMFTDSAFDHAFWGAKIVSLKTGEIWYERNANKMFNPASNQKIVTGSVALTKLGPDFRYQTTLSTNGSISNGVLNGDLIVFGTGDPTMYTRFGGDPRDTFRKWATILKQKGIRQVTGNIIGDDNAFDDERFGAGWAFDDFEYSYSAEINALQLNEGYVDLKIVPPTSASGSAQIIPNISTSYFTIENQLKVNAGGVNKVSIHRPYPFNTIKVTGEVLPNSRAINDAASISNQTLFFATVMKETLQENGVTVQGKALDCDDIPNWQHTPTDFATLDVQQSPPFAQVLKTMEKESQNLYAETFVRTLGLQLKGLGTFENGRSVVQETLQQWGSAPNVYQYYDGSGLSRQDYISPNVLVNVLSQMRQSPYWSTWYEALPIAGRDGTLQNRMKGTAAENNVRGKTGTISNVRGMSGYVTTADGEEVVFSFLVNGHLLSSRDTDRITDTVLAKVAAFRR
jgi:D-alanyl-D-alanine carboxypeptidase/D-alanyl-D-alanine-endopeptidase (penicillin-binding protein 4)